MGPVFLILADWINFDFTFKQDVFFFLLMALILGAIYSLPTLFFVWIVYAIVDWESKSSMRVKLNVWVTTMAGLLITLNVVFRVLSLQMALSYSLAATLAIFLISPKRKGKVDQ